MKQPDISVVVCTYNRAAMLRPALASLAALETDGLFTYEVLVVDNASTDDTQQAIEQVAAEALVAVRGVYESKKGIAAARNCGVKNARGEWIAFFDDDQLADPQWLKELISTAHEKRARCVGGAVRLRLPEEQTRRLAPLCRVLLGETLGMQTEQKYNRKQAPGCGNLLLHRSVFDDVGRFDNARSDRGEDTDLFWRLHEAGIDGWFTPKAVVHHVIPPYRLSNSYMRHLARHVGKDILDIDFAEWGTAGYPLIWGARFAYGCFVVAPKFFWASLRRDREEALSALCRWWMYSYACQIGPMRMLSRLRSPAKKVQQPDANAVGLNAAVDAELVTTDVAVH